MTPADSVLLRSAAHQQFAQGGRVGHFARARRILAIAGAATAFVALGCGRDSTSPGVVLRDAAGTWAAPFSIPGSGEQWTLSLSGTQVTGSGTWSGEACCSGTV